MIYIFYFLVLLTILAFLVIPLRRNGISFLFRNSIYLGSIFFIVIHLLLPILQIEVGFFRYPFDYTDIDFLVTLFVSFAIFIAFFSIFNLTIPNINNINVKSDIFYKYLFFSFLIFLIGLYFSLTNLESILSMGLEAYLSDRISFGYGSAYKMLLSDWVYVAAILFFVGYYISESKYLAKISFFIFLISFIYTLFYYSITGNRNSIFVLLVILTSIYYLFKNKNSKMKTLTKLVTSALVVIVFYILHYVGQARSSGFKSINTEDSSLKSLVESLNGAFGNNENIVWLVSNSYEYQYGITYIAALTNFFPRFLWPEKPLGAGPRLKNFIYPGNYIPGQEGNSSLTTGLITEVLMNFNFIFSLCFIVIFAFILKLIIKKFLHADNLFYILIGSILVVSISTLMLYSEFLGFFSRIFFMLLPLLIAAKIFKIRVLR